MAEIVNAPVRLLGTWLWSHLAQQRTKRLVEHAAADPSPGRTEKERGGLRLKERAAAHARVFAQRGRGRLMQGNETLLVLLGDPQAQHAGVE